ncbi:MAG: hypothetical protein QOD00_2010 [Blastocatellia bacterium]|nr:hypothetical protein [Blastocatellia bacterium]
MVQQSLARIVAQELPPAFEVWFDFKETFYASRNDA